MTNIPGNIPQHGDGTARNPQNCEQQVKKERKGIASGPAVPTSFMQPNLQPKTEVQLSIPLPQLAPRYFGRRLPPGRLLETP